MNAKWFERMVKIKNKYKDKKYKITKTGSRLNENVV